MPTTLNSLLKKYAPGPHHFLKQSLARSGLPVPKMLLGRPVWTHSLLLNWTPTEPHVLRWITNGLHPGDTFFDVGAHQGWMSLVASRQAGRKGKVVAFEPSPSLVEFLSYHKRVNRLSQMEIVPKAVTNQDDVEMQFRLVGDGGSYMNSLSGINIPELSPQDTSIIQVETTTLDSFSRHSGLVPAMIKIDVEGAELLVCEGAKHLLAQHHPALILATHPLWLPEGQKIEDLFALLSVYGYRIIDSEINKYNEADFGDYLCVAE
jgi:FkbM family methyltransferase